MRVGFQNFFLWSNLFFVAFSIYLIVTLDLSTTRPKPQKQTQTDLQTVKTNKRSSQHQVSKPQQTSLDTFGTSPILKNLENFEHLSSLESQEPSSVNHTNHKLSKGLEGLEDLESFGEREEMGSKFSKKSKRSGKSEKMDELRGGAGQFDEFLTELDKVRLENPNNLAAKYLTREIFATFSPEQQEILVKIARTGVENPSSQLGCYAMTPTDYDTFNTFFDPLIREYHQAENDAKHTTDWDTTDVGSGGVLDVADLGLAELSMRVRVGRNLKRFNLPGKMDKAERIAFEKTMLAAFAKLQAMPAYGGKVYSLTPDFGEGEANPNLISNEKYEELVKAHIMFKDMDADPYLKSAGISSDWPYGRGCYVSDDEQFIIWFGEEDQLRIMCMKKGTKLNEVFDRLREGLEVVESIDGIEFATNHKYGYVTSCPSNLGTGMRASVHIKIPNLTKDGTDARAKAVAKPLGLSVRGVGGEHTPIGEDGTVDISPSARLFIREKDIILNLFKGIKLLMNEEQKAGAEAS